MALGIWTVALLGSALASPEGTWRLVAHAPTAEDARSAEARAAGATGDAAIPACHRIATGLLLCAVAEAAPDKIAMVAELTEAGSSLEKELAGHRAKLEEHWGAQPARAHRVEGMVGRYFVRAAGDGYDAVGLLRPELLEELAGGAPVVAVPEDGTLLWWVPGAADFDKVVAVGVRRMVDASAAPVSARLYRWDAPSAGWAVWGEVRGSIELPVPVGAVPSSP